MKKLLLLNLLLLTISTACNNKSTNEKAIEPEVAVSEKGVKEVGVSKVEKKVTTVEKADGKTSASEGSWEGVNAQASEEESEGTDHYIMDVFDPDFINGRWEAEDQNGYSFGTWFDSEEGIVIGQYCAMNHDASRIDCGTQEEVESCYLKSGSVKGKKMLELEVVSCYALKKGKATLTPQGDGHLIWRLVEPPGEFEVDHFAPEVALLRKVSFDPYE